MMPLQQSSTVRLLTIAALLGVIPCIGSAQNSVPAPAASPAANANEKTFATEQVAVAAREIARGKVLVMADIAYASSDSRVHVRSLAPPEVTTPATSGDSLIGFVTRRLIATGQPLRAPAVVPPLLVKAGDAVDVTWDHDGILVSLRGRATRSAALGERIAVRVDAKRNFEGTVVAAGRVRVN